MILLCVGTRPEWLKIKPLVPALGSSAKLLLTGQHTDLLDGIPFDYALTIPETTERRRLDQIVASCLINFPDEFQAVLVQGDTASAFACALAAFHRQTTVCHLEAGLRTYSRQPYPEEAYRQMIARIADICLCPTALAAQNLKTEKTNGQIHVVGNTALDNLVLLRDGCRYGDTVLVTLHRRENQPHIRQWLAAVDEIARDRPALRFIFPAHPAVTAQTDSLRHVNVIPPMPHTELLATLTQTKLVITDSGGLQEESAFFNKKVVVCRASTERPEGITSGHLYLCPQPEKLRRVFESVNAAPEINAQCPYGDGKSAMKIVDILRAAGIVKHI